MVYKIKFISDEVDGFVREVEIDSDSTFLDLNKIILDSCGFPDDQMTSFFICDEEWERKEQITREDMETADVDEDIYVMEETPLTDFIEEEEQKLEFIFDPFAERSFFLDVKEIRPGEHLKHPKITRVKGDAPKQIVDIDFSVPAAKVVATTFDEDEAGEFYGSDQFESDEFDPEGFEISDENIYE